MNIQTVQNSVIFFTGPDKVSHLTSCISLTGGHNESRKTHEHKVKVDAVQAKLSLIWLIANESSKANYNLTSVLRKHETSSVCAQ